MCFRANVRPQLNLWLVGWLVLLSPFTVHQTCKSILRLLKGVGFLCYQKEYQYLAVQPRCLATKGDAMQHYSGHLQLSHKVNS